MGFILGFICGSSLVGVFLLMIKFFRPRREIPDWTEEAYRLEQPRVVAYIKTTDIEWEIK